MNVLRNLALLACAVSLASSATLDHPEVSSSKQRFQGSQVLRAFASTPSQVSLLGTLQNGNNELDFWTEPRLNGFTDIMAEGASLQDLKTVLEKHQIPFHVSIGDVDKLVLEEEARRAAKLGHLRLQTERNLIDWSEYYSLEAIENWLVSVGQNNSNVQIITIGESTQGRNITLAKISNGDGNSTKPAIFITANIHAREWISSAAATYMIDQLVHNSSAHPDILDSVDFYILPVINPDGFAFSHSTNRMWRKTRSNHQSALGCIGADANRNFDFKWSNGDVSGSSGDKCSETYRGPEAFSEPEAAAIRDFVTANAKEVNWAVYITLHSYGQYFLAPWGYTQGLPENYDALKSLSDVASKALWDKHGTNFTTGASSVVLYFTDGTDQDWALGSGFFPYSYTMELRDTGRYGFVLPAEQIVPCSEETFEAIKVVARNKY